MKIRFPFLTADDWGMSPAINAGISELAHLGLIRRISVMSVEPYANLGLSDLKKIPDLHFGIHFDLIHRTEFKSPTHLMKKWLFSSIEKKQVLKKTILSKLQNQISAFDDLKIPVSYFDSHQHTHLIPGIFELIAPTLKAKNIHQIRVPLDWSLLGTSKFPITLLSLRLKTVISKLGFSTLPFCYPQSPAFRDSSKLTKVFQANSHKEILVHPATKDDLTELQIPDAYRAERVLEYSILKQI